MKKTRIVSFVALVSILSINATLTLDAKETNPDALQKEARFSGDWFSSVSTNKDGFSNVGTKNNTSNRYFTLRIVDIDGGDTEYSKSMELSLDQTAQSGLEPTTISHSMQGQVLTTSTNHSPWFNA